MFQKLFGGPKRNEGFATSSTNGTVDAIQQLAEALELLERRKEVLEKRIVAELGKAKAFMAAKNKSGATNAIKRKKLLEAQLEALDNNIMRVMEQQQMLESSQVQVTTVSAMHNAAKAQKATMSKFKVEKVDEIMEDIQDVADQTAEIQQALAQPLGGAAGLDDDEIADELAALEAAQLEEELLQPATIPSGKVAAPARGEALVLPSVPSSAPKPAKTTEEELQELERELMAS